MQNVFSVQYDVVAHARPAPAKAGGLVEHYQDNMVNPTFSLGSTRSPNLRAFLREPRRRSFVGLTPEAQFDRYWRFTLFGVYAAGRLSSSRRG